MGKYNTGNEEMDLGFQNPSPGISIMQIQEGIKLNVKEDSENKSLIIPMVIVEVEEGEPENIEKKCSLFINLVTGEGKENSFGEKTICSLLTFTKDKDGSVLADKFEKKFPDDTAFTDDQFIDALCLKLPGQMIKVKHDIRSYKDNEGNDREAFNAVKIMKVAKKSTAVNNDSAGSGSNDAAANDGDDW